VIQVKEFPSLSTISHFVYEQGLVIESIKYLLVSKVNDFGLGVVGVCINVKFFNAEVRTLGFFYPQIPIVILLARIIELFEVVSQFTQKSVES